jgi:hypothetical protein
MAPYRDADVSANNPNNLTAQHWTSNMLGVSGLDVMRRLHSVSIAIPQSVDLLEAILVALRTND